MNIIRVQGFFENILAVHKWIYYYGSLTFFHFLLTIADFYLIFNLQFKCTFMERTFYLAPIGLLEITGSEQGISGISFADHVDTVIENPVCLRECVKQLHEYFDNSRKSFDITHDLAGSEFQRKVWNDIYKIPFGKTCSYNDIAKKLGDKEAVRAVGHAVGKNPLAIIIPCHRVIGSDGKLVGYAGGLWRKKWLLNFENKDVQGELFI